MHKGHLFTIFCMNLIFKFFETKENQSRVKNVHRTLYQHFSQWTKIMQISQDKTLLL